MVRRFVAFAECVDKAVDWFCAVCDGPRLAYGQMIDPPKPPTLVGPMDEGGRRWVPSRRNLLRLVEVLEYFHAVRKHRQLVSFAELARAVCEGGDERILSASFLRGCPYVREYSRRRRPGEPRQRYVKLDVKKPWETLGDVIEVLNDREGGGADVDLVVKVFYSLCPGFNKLLSKGLSNLRDLFVAFPGTFEVSSDGKVRCVAPFDDPEPEREISGCYRNDVHTREDLEGIVSLADAAAKYPGVKSGYSISVGALYAWGRERYLDVPCWRSISSFRRFLYGFRKSGYYRLGEGKVRSYGRSGSYCRIEAIRTVIRVVGEADGFASCETVADVVNRWVPGFGGNLDKDGLVMYVRGLKGRQFVLDGERRIADGLVAYDVRGDVACWYYSRYLAKKKVLGEGVAVLRGSSGRDFGTCKFSKVAAWVAWLVVEWSRELRLKFIVL